MLKKVILFLFVICFSQNVFGSEYAIVKVEYANIRENATIDGISIDKYNNDDVIHVIAETQDEISNTKWLLTPKGYVNSNDVFMDNDLPKFINYEDINFSKYGLQLIVYKAGVTQSLYKLRKLLINEKNIYLEKRKNVYVIYLVNIDTPKIAQAKAKEYKKNFPSLFISIPEKQKSEILTINTTNEKIDILTPSISENNTSTIISNDSKNKIQLENNLIDTSKNEKKIKKITLTEGIENILLNNE